MGFTDTNAFIGKFPRFDFYTATSRRAALDRLDILATWLDTAVLVPGTNIRFGVEALLRLWPVIGDASCSRVCTFSCTCFIVQKNLACRVSCWRACFMNVVIEGTVGAIPIAGDAFDVFIPCQPSEYRSSPRAIC